MAGDVHITVVEHDPEWGAAFARERSLILWALGDLVVRVHHIGSTAIPGILAKPVIDILVEVEDIAALDAAEALVERLGYEAMGEFGIPGRRFYRKDDAGGRRTHHVHAFSVGHGDIDRHLAFRDYMIAHRAEALRYGELKADLARRFPDDIEGYTTGKDAFVKEHQAKALAWREQHRGHRPCA